MLASLHRDWRPAMARPRCRRRAPQRISIDRGRCRGCRSTRKGGQLGLTTTRCSSERTHFARYTARAAGETGEVSPRARLAPADLVHVRVPAADVGKADRVRRPGAHELRNARPGYRKSAPDPPRAKTRPIAVIARRDTISCLDAGRRPARERPFLSRARRSARLLARRKMSACCREARMWATDRALETRESDC